MNQKLEFFLSGSPVGYFEGAAYPRIPGRYRYMPYRGRGHLEMIEAVRSGEHPQCSFIDSDGQREFVVAGVPEHGVVDVEAFVEGNRGRLA
jgi:hypothetical protein